MTVHEKCACGAEIRVYPNRVGMSDQQKEMEKIQNEISDWRDAHRPCLKAWQKGAAKARYSR